MNRFLIIGLVLTVFSPVNQCLAQKMPSSVAAPNASKDKANGIGVPGVNAPPMAGVPVTNPPAPGLLDPARPQPPASSPPSSRKSCDEYSTKYGKTHPAC